MIVLGLFALSVGIVRVVGLSGDKSIECMFGTIDYVLSISERYLQRGLSRLCLAAEVFIVIFCFFTDKHIVTALLGWGKLAG